MLAFVKCHKEDNVEVMRFHIKSNCVQNLVFVEIKFQKCTMNFDLENDEVGLKMTTVNLKTLLASNILACSRIFMQPHFR